MKRRDFLKRCGEIVVAGLSAIPFSKKIAKLEAIQVFSKKPDLKHLLILDRNGHCSYFFLKKIQNGWAHYEPHVNS
jgi:hypothetical protein